MKKETRYCAICHKDCEYQILVNEDFVARGSSHVDAWDSSHVEAWGSSHVVARESSHVEARESSHVVAGGSLHVEAWESSHVEAWENVFIRLFSALKIEASASVVIMLHGKAKTITGGKKIKATKPATAIAWCKFHGVTVNAGVALLYKAVDADYKSPHGMSYAPKTRPKAEDWDDGKAECGGGLHFSPTPGHALSFHNAARRFIACGVKVSEIVVHPDGSYPEKIKAPRVSGACYEVDRYGKKV